MTRKTLRATLFLLTVLGWIGTHVEGASLRVIAAAGMPAPGDTGNFRNFGQLDRQLDKIDDLRAAREEQTAGSLPSPPRKALPAGE